MLLNAFLCLREGAPVWPREIIEPVVVSAGLPLVLSCDPPPGPPKPETYWMSSCECLSRFTSFHSPQFLVLRHELHHWGLSLNRRKIWRSVKIYLTWTYFESCFISGSYARPFNWPIQTAFPTMQPVRQDRRVSMGENGDLYFSNILVNDSAADYCCNARFPYKNVIQQKMPVVVKVLTSEYNFILTVTSVYVFAIIYFFLGHISRCLHS